MPSGDCGAYAHAQGTVIANADYGLAPEGAEWPTRTVRTNADGDLRLKLAPGRYELWRGSGAGPAVEVAGFAWASTGPSPAVLAIPQ